jgi:hypothetical protein
LPVIGAPSFVAMGARSTNLLSPGRVATSVAHADQARVTPRRNKNPLPASATVAGSLLNEASWSWRRMAMLPRLLTSYSSVPLPRAAHLGTQHQEFRAELHQPASIARRQLEVGHRRVRRRVRIERKERATAQLFIGAGITEFDAGGEVLSAQASRSARPWRQPATRGPSKTMLR